MLKYIVIIIDDSSVSYCNYANRSEANQISLETLRKGIIFAMKHDLKIQYLLPKYKLSDEYMNLINSMYHDNIGPKEQYNISGIIVIDGWDINLDEEYVDAGKRYILRTTIDDFHANYPTLNKMFDSGLSVNIAFTDTENFSDDKIEAYTSALDNIASHLGSLLLKGYNVNTNLITDRIALKGMNNCGAGDTSITLAPNGKFYPCPAFYYCKMPYYKLGDVDTEVKIPNEKLFRLEGSPLCKTCDAFQCKRCVWLSKKLTYEVNIPSRQQCIMAHIERNASKHLLDEFHKKDILTDRNIEAIDYLDPFDEYQKS